jgi:hypothetical protein
MKKILIVLALVLSMLPLLAQFRNEVVWWEEDFESAAQGWSHDCSPTNMWHIQWIGGEWSFPVWLLGEYYGTSYLDHQYLVLDTPERTLADSNAVLTFDFYCNIQDTTGATAPYDGWDAFNVRISTDGGNTWTPIYGTPAYNMTSSYAFGAVFGEGPGIPGWGGYVDGQGASFDLSSYVGQSVKIRFAFASDDSVQTGDCMFIYNITFGGYSNGNGYYSAADDGQMTVANLGNQIEDIWHVATDITAPSPTHIMKFQNAQGTYDPSIMAYLVSPPIQLPSTGDIRFDFMFRGGFSWNNYFLLEIAGNDGIWNNFDSYIVPPNTWSVYDPWWNLSDYAGQTVRFRWTVVTGGEAPQGIGLLMDDFRIYHSLEINPPQNLGAIVDEQNHTVILTWEAPDAENGEPQARDVDFYKIFRDDAEIAMINGTLLSYTDLNVPGGMHHYYVVAADDIYQSEPTNLVPAYIPTDTQTELLHDDGTAEAGFGVEQAFRITVKYNCEGQITLKYVKVYVDSLGSAPMPISIFNDESPNGMPGSSLIQFYCPNSSISHGWNWIALPEDLILSNCYFYIVITRFGSSPEIGLDTSSSGFSYIYNSDTDWELITTGELMIRAIGEPVVANDDNIIPPLILDVWNYPNPFNPETTISYTLPNKGQVCLEIYNSKGQLVKSLLNEQKPKGEHSLTWNGKDNNGHSVASGLYLCRITSAGKHESRKILLLK